MSEYRVVVRCVKCKAERAIGMGEVAADDYPMCAACYSPMTPVRAVPFLNPTPPESER